MFEPLPTLPGGIESPLCALADASSHKWPGVDIQKAFGRLLLPQLVAASVVWACVSWRTQRPHEVRGGLELLEGYFDIGESGG